MTLPHNSLPPKPSSGINVNGKLPVSINHYYPAGTGLSTPKLRLGYYQPESCGMDSQTLLKIDSICQAAIKQKATPGCQVLVAKDGYVVYNKAFGFNTYDKKKKKYDRQHIRHRLHHENSGDSSGSHDAFYDQQYSTRLPYCPVFLFSSGNRQARYYCQGIVITFSRIKGIFFLSSSTPLTGIKCKAGCSRQNTRKPIPVNSGIDFT